MRKGLASLMMNSGFTIANFLRCFSVLAALLYEYLQARLGERTVRV